MPRTNPTVNFPACIDAMRELAERSRELDTLSIPARNRIDEGRYEEALSYLLGCQLVYTAIDKVLYAPAIAALQVCRMQIKCAVPATR